MLEVVGRWIEDCREKRIFWTHDGNPKRPHLLLPGAGEHADGCFDRFRAAEDPVILHMGGRALIELVKSQGFDPYLTTRTLGVGKGGPNLAHTLAHILTYTRPIDRKTERCLSASLDESIGSGDRRTSTRSTRIFEGEHVLPVLVVFTPEAMRPALEAIHRAGAIPVRFVGALANFSGMREMGRHRVVALIERDIRRWAGTEACELCREGSDAIVPEGAENWRRLTREY